jgi:hypothetical protein
MSLLNSGLGNALGRPDLVFSAQSASIGAPPIATVVGGSTQAYNSDTSPVTGGGRAALIALLALIGGYAAFTWWVKPILA